MIKAKKLFFVSVLALVCALSVAVGVLISTPKTVLGATITGEFALENGAYIRDDSADTSGLKFAAQIDKTYYDALKTDYPNADAGMIIVPTEYGSAENANGYTMNALSSFIETAYAGGEAPTFNVDCNNEFRSLPVGEATTHYGYTLTLSKILDNNYARSMTAVGYIKLPQAQVEAKDLSGETVSITANGATKTATLFNGYYYIYTESLSRSVYEVAYNAYTDETEPVRNDTVKGYIDGVVDISYSAGTATIANNKDGENGYTAPYTLTEDANGDYRFDKNSGTIKSILYNGEITDTLPFDGVQNNIYTVKKASGVYEGNSATLASSPMIIGSPAKWYPQAAIAFEGKYDVGTYVSFTFRGNNMPYVMFFADTINNTVSTTDNANTALNGNGEKGVLYMNGAKRNTGTDEAKITIHGPNRRDIGLASAFIAESSTSPVIFSTLANNPDTEYVVSIGTEWDSNNVLNVIESVSVSGTGFKVVNTYVCKNTAITDGRDSSIDKGDVQAGNIMLITPFNGIDSGVNFTFTAPSDTDPLADLPDMSSITFSGVTPNIDGSVTHEGESWQQGGYSWNIWGQYARYTAFMGNYGVGTYIDFEFTGKFLPQVMFFGAVQSGDEANTGNFSRYGNGANSNTTDCNRQGVIVLNTATSDGSATGTVQSGLQVYGPNRLGKYNQTVENGGADPRFGSGAIATSSNTAINHYNLVDTTKYKYTIGTYANGSTVVLDIKLINLDTDTTVVEETVNLPSTIGVDSTGYICFHLPFVYANGTTYTIKTGLPYTK